MKLITMSPFMLLAAIMAAPTMAADTEAGKEQLKSNCYACHGDEVYTRADRRITSRPALTAQVHRCQVAQGLGWFDDEVENTAEYLNIQFYHFK